MKPTTKAGKRLFRDLNGPAIHKPGYFDWSSIGPAIVAIEVEPLIDAQNLLESHLPYIKFHDGLPVLTCACGWDDSGDSGWHDHLADAWDATGGTPTMLCPTCDGPAERIPKPCGCGCGVDVSGFCAIAPTGIDRALLAEASSAIRSILGCDLSYIEAPDPLDRRLLLSDAISPEFRASIDLTLSRIDAVLAAPSLPSAEALAAAIEAATEPDWVGRIGVTFTMPLTSEVSAAEWAAGRILDALARDGWSLVKIVPAPAPRLPR